MQIHKTLRQSNSYLIMTEYKSVPFNLSSNQIMRINKAIKDNTDVTIQIGMKNVVPGTHTGNFTLNLTPTQVKKLISLSGDRQIRFHLSKTQLSAGATGETTKTRKDISRKIKELSLAVTPGERGKINEEIVKLMALLDIDESTVQEGSGIGSLFKLALPVVKKVLPKIAATLGLSAISGAVSGATHKATKGKGLERVGGKITLNKNEMKQLMRLGNACTVCGLVEKDFVGKMNSDIKKQSGGFLGTLLASVAAR